MNTNNPNCTEKCENDVKNTANEQQNWWTSVKYPESPQESER